MPAISGSWSPAPRSTSSSARQLDGEALIRLLLDELHAFTGPGWEQEDDITLVTLERPAAGIETSRPAEPGRPAEAAAELSSHPIRREHLVIAAAEAVTNPTEQGGGT